MYKISDTVSVFGTVFSFFDKKTQIFCGKIENKKGKRKALQNTSYVDRSLVCYKRRLL